MPRFLLVLGLLFLIPGLVIGGQDLLSPPVIETADDQAATFSTVAQLWIKYNKSGFMTFRNGYIGKANEWETNVLPYLNLKVAPILVGPGVVLLVLSLCWWLLAPGGHRHGRKSYTSSSEFGRNRAANTQTRMRYTRK